MEGSTNIKTALQERYSGSREDSRVQLKRIGFSYKKCESNRKETIQKNEEKIMLNNREINKRKNRNKERKTKNEKIALFKKGKGVKRVSKPDSNP